MESEGTESGQQGLDLPAPDAPEPVAEAAIVVERPPIPEPAPLTSHVVFSSGWEWGYWQNDLAALRASGGRRRELVVIEVQHLDLSPLLAPSATEPTAVAAPVPAAPGLPRRSLQDIIEDTKRRHIAAAVEEAGGNWAEAARLLQLDRANLHRLARRLGMANK